MSASNTIAAVTAACTIWRICLDLSTCENSFLVLWLGNSWENRFTEYEQVWKVYCLVQLLTMHFNNFGMHMARTLFFLENSFHYATSELNDFSRTGYKSHSIWNLPVKLTTNGHWTWMSKARENWLICPRQLQDRNSVLGILTRFSPFSHILTLSRCTCLTYSRCWLHFHSLLYTVSNKRI